MAEWTPNSKSKNFTRKLFQKISWFTEGNNKRTFEGFLTRIAKRFLKSVLEREIPNGMDSEIINEIVEDIPEKNTKDFSGSLLNKLPIV